MFLDYDANHHAILFEFVCRPSGLDQFNIFLSELCVASGGAC